MKIKSAPPLKGALFKINCFKGTDEYARNTGHQSQPAAIAPHDFDHEGARVTVCGGVDIVDRFADALKRGRRANRQICQGHVVVD